ncbi:MAG: hypothetical protein HOI47_25220 [Candidatus Scalindua sp.]|jgi:hypothetical protein|nr:hypothetical protein [Gammaproteobacteria bacterium]MBT6229957.1 hypothetical protein [Candidatus Scalindua sp.]
MKKMIPLFIFLILIGAGCDKQSITFEELAEERGVELRTQEERFELKLQCADLGLEYADQNTSESNGIETFVQSYCYSEKYDSCVALTQTGWIYNNEVALHRISIKDMLTDEELVSGDLLDVPQEDKEDSIDKFWEMVNCLE